MKQFHVQVVSIRLNRFNAQTVKNVFLYNSFVTAMQTIVREIMMKKKKRALQVKN